jgi:hypothetical protein
LSEARVFRLTTGPGWRFLGPGCVSIVALVGVGAIVEQLGRRRSSPLIYVPVAVVAVALLWLLVTTPHRGDLTISGSQITRKGYFGLSRTIPRNVVKSIVKVTVIDAGRYGRSQTDQLLLLDADRHCRLIIDTDYDLTGLAQELGVTIEWSAGGPIRRYDLNKQYPGATLPVNPWILTGLVLVAAAGLALALALPRP